MIDMIDLTQVDWNMFVLCFAFAVIDVIAGLLKAFASNDFSSSTMRTGLMHKAGTMLVLLCAGVCDVSSAGAGVELPFGVGIVDAFGVLVIAMELGSVLENCVGINPELGKLPLFKIFGIDSDVENGDE